jgi:serine phosphatase RsbU (regulator of sigma subunit)/anti-sigma regulatory factor (Ser/Thr protein kinase)
VSKEACEFFDPEPAAVSRARGFARDTLFKWGISSPLGDDAILLISELVTNAVLHAGTRARLTLRLNGGALEAEVADAHPARTLPDPPQFETNLPERRRGLVLPTALARTWGVTYTATEKTVWFRLPTDSGPVSLEPPVTAPDPELARELGRMEFPELVRHTLEGARDSVGADAAYALLADEEGELRVRGAAGIAVPAALLSSPASVVLSDGVAAESTLVVPFVVDGRVIGLLGVAAAAPDRFTLDDQARAQAVADRVAMTLERMRLSELERVRRGRVAFLAEASEMLSSTLDQMQAAALAAQLVVPRLAAWCAVYMTEAFGEPELAYVWHADETQADALRELLEEIPPPMLGAGSIASGSRSWSLAIGNEVRLSEAALLLARDSAWSFPLTARGRGLGMVVIGRTRGDPRWPDPPSQQAFEMAEDLTRRVALALDNARLYEKQRLANQALQRSLLPPELPSIPRVDLAVAYQAAGETNEVGGDFYDVFSSRPGTWRFAIGDVCGTGPEAAAVTGLARNTLRILAAEGHDIPTVVQRLNDLILREGPRARFLTLLHGEISVPADAVPAEAAATEAAATEAAAAEAAPVHMALVCAGHPLPLLIPAAGGPVRPIADPQPLLGVIPDASFRIQEVKLERGDIVVCVTDGVTERRDDRGDLLDDEGGLPRLLSSCGGMSAAAVVARVQRVVEEFSSTQPNDDMAILAIRAR